MNVKSTIISEKEEFPNVDLQELRQAISKEYEAVAKTPDKGFHFHTGRRLTGIVEYDSEWLEDIPEYVIESFAGTGNPFAIGTIVAGESVVDLGCGAGIDTFIAAKKVGPTGQVIGVDMTETMLDKARKALEDIGYSQVQFKSGIIEELPIADNWADVIISNGVFNLAPNKEQVLREIYRVLKPGGRLQIADILVQKKVPESAKRKIDLWTG
jgi:arsenite methyltransferase